MLKGINKNMKKVIYWDFHGTLAYNDWMFSKALFKVINKYEHNSIISIDDFKNQPLTGFPWQQHEKDYSHLTHSDDWWENAQKIFTEVYPKFNIPQNKAILYAEKVRYEVTKPDEFLLYDDTLEILDFFKNEGFSNIVLSNHIPELPDIVEKLGIGCYIEDCISSANVGYEKPNPKIYNYALEKAKNPEVVWMIGDNVIADVRGSEEVGIKGVLVRSNRENSIKYYSKDLRGLKEIIR